jgi:type III secretion protein L
MSLIRRNSEQARSAAAFQTARPEVAGAAPTASAPKAEQADPRDIRIAALRADCEALNEEIAALKAEVEAVRVEAFDEGCEAGRNEVETREAERLAQLSDALNTARQEFDEHLSLEQGFGIEIALAALRKVLGDPGHYRDLVAKTAQHHAAGLASSTVIRLSVSTADFPDEAALAPLQSSLAQVRVEADPAMPRGSCRFALTHGQLDAEIPSQATSLEALLIQSHPGVAERV